MGQKISIVCLSLATALMCAAQNGQTETAEVLLREGADVSVQEKDGYTALHWAAQEGYTAVVSSLLRALADPNSVASWRGGTTPLMMAALGGHLEIVDLLLSSQAEVNQTRSDGWTALMLAAAYGHVNVLKRLTETKADVNKLTEDGLSALDLAKAKNFTEVCELLVTLGAKPGGPGSQERAKTGLAKLWAQVKKALKGPLTSSFQDLDIGGVKGRRKQKEDANTTISPTQTSH